MGTIQGYCPGCQTHSRDYHLCNGCRVQVSNGLSILEAVSRTVCLDQQRMALTGGGPICCDSSVQSTLKVLQLETRPTSRGNRCLQSEVESPEGVCKSPMVPGRQNPQNNYSCGASLEGTALVPSSAGQLS